MCCFPYCIVYILHEEEQEPQLEAEQDLERLGNGTDGEAVKSPSTTSIWTEPHFFSSSALMQNV